MIVVVISISLMVLCLVLLIGEARKHRAMGTSKQGESPPGHTLRSARVNSGGLAWMISLPVLFLSIVASGWLYPRALFPTFVPSPGFVTAAYLQAYNVSCGVLIWLVFRSTIGRNQGDLKSVISLLAISGSVLATVLIGNREASIAMEEIQRHVSSLVSSGGEANSTVTRARGEFGEIERFFKTQLSEMASLTRDYERKLAAIGWETILDPDSLGRDPTLIMSVSIVENAKKIVADQKTSTYDLCEDSKQAVWDIPISEWAKQHMVNDLLQLLEEMHAALDERWDWEAQIIAVVEQVVAWLSARPDAWTVENGVLVFANESDLSQFKSYMIQLDKVTNQQGAWKRQ